MRQALLRWWRWLVNPMPLVGQVWDLDGVGLVQVTSVDQYTLKGKRLSGGDPMQWLVRVFRAQAVLRDLRLEDLSGDPKAPGRLEER